MSVWKETARISFFERQNVSISSKYRGKCNRRSWQWIFEQQLTSARVSSCCLWEMPGILLMSYVSYSYEVISNKILMTIINSHTIYYLKNQILKIYCQFITLFTTVSKIKIHYFVSRFFSFSKVMNFNDIFCFSSWIKSIVGNKNHYVFGDRNKINWSSFM